MAYGQIFKDAHPNRFMSGKTTLPVDKRFGIDEHWAGKPGGPARGRRRLIVNLLFSPYAKRCACRR